VTADVRDRQALSDLARETRVLINTVGPYATHGDGAVAACAAAGTDYLDLAAEDEFVDLCFVRHHDRAAQTGARLIHGCGFESVPFDLGTRCAVKHLPRQVPVRVSAYVELGLGGFGAAARGFSSGSVGSALSMLSRPRQRRRARKARLASEPLPENRALRAPWGRPHRVREPQGWAVPAPRFDSRVVVRSAAALDCSRGDFTYQQYVVLRRLRTAMAMAGAGAGMTALARVPPLRRLALGRLAPGAGPGETDRRRRSFTVTLIAEADGHRVVTTVSGGDPGYDESAKMLAEAALCLRYDNLPRRAGQLTPAVAMGEALTSRLAARGIVFSTRTG
jgi:short subunit dehydrogenase-like uncharacterized protein